MPRDDSPETSLFEAAPDPIVAYASEDGTARATAANAAFRDAFDPDEPVAGRELGSVLVTDGEGSFLDRLGEAPETIVAGPGDTDRAFRLRAVPADDGSTGYAVYTDVTADRERVRELEERIARLDQLVSVVVHDLRNPLEVAGIRLEAARETGDDVHFEKIAAAHDRIDELLDELRETTRTWDEIGPVEPLDLEAAVRTAWEGVATEAATIEIAGDLGDLPADAEGLRRLLENLFRNAVDHAASGGDADGGGRSVHVRVGPLEEAGFYVADDGPGIPAENREEVFEVGFSTRSEGDGLGLAIVEGIASAHGWSVTVTESDGGGARFEIRASDEPADADTPS